MDLIDQAIAAGVRFRAIVSDCFSGENNSFESTLLQRRLPYVLARRGNAPLGWAAQEVTHTLREAAGEVPASAWRKVKCTFRDGHVECWWTCELRLLRYGPDKLVRAICATSDRATRPEISTWYLTTNLSAQQAPLAHVVRLYGLRNWIEQGYKQMKHELGWADFMVRGDRAIRRHWTLLLCALTFCWWHEAHQALVVASAARPGDTPEPARKKTGAGKHLIASCWPRALRAERA